MTWRRLFLLDLALLALMILVSRVALVLHEGAGHAIPACLFGARKIVMRLSPLGGGFVSAEYPPGTHLSRPATVVFGMGGIALNLLSGMGAWIWARRLKSRGLGYVALLFFGVGSVLSANAYLSCGIYYNSGDPVSLAPESEDLSAVWWTWVLFLAPALAIAWFGMRHFVDFLSGYADLSTPGRRLGWMLATVGAAGLCYGGLWLCLRNLRVEGSTSSWRLEREIQAETARRTAEQSAIERAELGRPRPPGLRPAPPRPVIVRPEEVAQRVPPPVGPLVLHGATLVALGWSVWRAAPSPWPGLLRPGIPAALAVLAGLLVAAFRLWG